AGGLRHPVARLSPVTLAASAQIRLRRLVPGAAYREDRHEVVVPLDGKGAAGARSATKEPAAELLRALVDALLPPEG
ncbi:MAG: hypothetical protein ACRDY3_05630, partial [Acidimicrobiales bacterium]